MLMCINLLGEEYIWNKDLDNDGRIEKIEIYAKHDTFHLKIDTLDYNLQSQRISTIVDEKNKDHVIIFFDIEHDNNIEIAISTEHFAFADRSITNVYKYENKSIIPMKFYYSLEEYWDYLISKDKITVWNSSDNSLYIIAGKQAYDTTNGETIFFNKVDLYRWSNEVKKIIRFGEKLYKDIDKENLKNLIF